MTPDQPDQIRNVQQFLDECFHGAVAAAAAHLEPNVVYRVPGEHKLAGVFEGPDAVVAHLGALLEITHNSIDVFKWEDWLVGDSHIAALAHIRLQKPGVVLVSKFIFLCVLSKSGKIAEVEVYFSDPRSVDRFLQT
jgi:ketosteroid isomerase-like protein